MFREITAPLKINKVELLVSYKELIAKSAGNPSSTQAERVESRIPDSEVGFSGVGVSSKLL